MAEIQFVPSLRVLKLSYYTAPFIVKDFDDNFRLLLQVVGRLLISNCLRIFQSCTKSILHLLVFLLEFCVESYDLNWVKIFDCQPITANLVT